MTHVVDISLEVAGKFSALLVTTVKANNHRILAVFDIPYNTTGTINVQFTSTQMCNTIPCAKCDDISTNAHRIAVVILRIE